VTDPPQPIAARTAGRVAGWVATVYDVIRGTVLDDLLVAVRRTRVLDLSYTIAAQAFVALIPLVLVVTGMFFDRGDQSAIGEELITRLDLYGAGSQAVRMLFQSPGSGSGVYWLGLVITLYSAFSLSRRVSRAYTTLWGVAPLPVGQQWRGIVWVFLQVGLTIAASTVRGVGRDHGLALEVAVVVALLVVWGVGELYAQRLLTGGQVAWSRLRVAAALVSVGRIGVGAWSAVYLPGALERQAEQYGPIGVVFGLFTWIFATAAVLVIGTLLAAVLTARPLSAWLTRSPSDVLGPAGAPAGPTARSRNVAPAVGERNEPGTEAVPPA
jgi:uncharacterized BrkB/YihY/UPF0761 family membrane protein